MDKRERKSFLEPTDSNSCNEQLAGALILFCLVCGVLFFEGEMNWLSPHELRSKKERTNRVLGLDVAKVEKNVTVATETQRAESLELGSGSFTCSSGLLINETVFKPSPWFKFQGEEGSVSVNVNTGEVAIEMDGVKSEAEAGKVAAVIFWEAFGAELKRLCSESEKEN